MDSDMRCAAGSRPAAQLFLAAAFRTCTSDGVAAWWGAAIGKPCRGASEWSRRDEWERAGWPGDVCRSAERVSPGRCLSAGEQPGRCLLAVKVFLSEEIRHCAATASSEAALRCRTRCSRGPGRGPRGQNTQEKPAPIYPCEAIGAIVMAVVLPRPLRRLSP